MNLREAHTVLIVDDNPVNLALLRALLTKDAQFYVVEATSGQETLDIVRATPELDLILLDVMLPDMNGIDICRTLKQDPHTSGIPIVLISAVQKDDESIATGLDAGADGYLTKPVDNTALHAWLKATLRISALQRALAAKETPDIQGYEQLLTTFSKLSHAVNNPLQSIMATADLLLLDLEDGEQALPSLRTIQVQAEQIARMVAEASRLAKEHLRVLGKPPEL